MMRYFVYILLCKDNSFYTGITTDLNRRFREHQSGKGGHYTRSRGVLKIVFIEEWGNRSLASKREVEIKKLCRKEKLKLMNNLMI